MARAAPRAVFWDIGNVIVRWNPRTLYAQIFPDPAECDRFLSEVCTMDWHLAHDRGVSFAENRAPLVARFPHYEPQIRAWQERWWDMFSGAIPETEAVIHDLAARGVPMFGLSNISPEVIDGVRALSPAFAHISGVIVSGAEGVLKPDPAIFRLACERFGFEPGEVLFVDDGPVNVAAAEALGFSTHHFTDPAGLRPAVQALGLL